MTSPIGNTLPSFLSHAYSDPFSRNRLAPIPDFKKENNDPLAPLTTWNKLSGITRHFAHCQLHPNHLLLHPYPLPLSTTALPVLLLLTCPPPPASNGIC